MIFLDFDGVLNSLSSAALYTMLRGREEGFVNTAAPNPTSVGLLDVLLAREKISIVVSSSWRQGRTVDELQSVLENEFHLRHWYRVIGKTRPNDRGECRADQIDAWVRANPQITHYCILDDDSDMLETQQKYFVQTDRRTGFSIEDFHKVKTILGL